MKLHFVVGDICIFGQTLFSKFTFLCLRFSVSFIFCFYFENKRTYYSDDNKYLQLHIIIKINEVKKILNNFQRPVNKILKTFALL